MLNGLTALLISDLSKLGQGDEGDDCITSEDDLSHSEDEETPSEDMELGSPPTAGLTIGTKPIALNTDERGNRPDPLMEEEGDEEEEEEEGEDDEENEGRSSKKPPPKQSKLV